MTSVVWHYTTGERFAQICNDGYIRQATAGVPKGEKPAVWFSNHPVWEPTANKGIRLPNCSTRTATREETSRFGGGLVRIGVAPETAPHDLNSYRLTSGVKAWMYKALVRSAKKSGANPNQWRVSYDAVPMELWTRVEVWHEGKWVNVPLDDEEAA